MDIRFVIFGAKLYNSIHMWIKIPFNGVEGLTKINNIFYTKILHQNVSDKKKTKNNLLRQTLILTLL